MHSNMSHLFLMVRLVYNWLGVNEVNNHDQQGNMGLPLPSQLPTSVSRA